MTTSSKIVPSETVTSDRVPSEKTHTTESLIVELSTNAATVSFEQVMQVINDNYVYTATTFTNGGLVNEAGTNEGSCKVIYFCKLNNLSEQQTLACFGRYYREDVLEHPQANDHGNIRNFIKTGWSGIEFNGIALVVK
jgi:hypothetical protein